ncbi:MAG: hypothetical protein NUV41_16535 [Eubacteriales bacterium]|jgi:putative FmdB family regulatory protein|nr:hypothetical protein [Eubacteriales bacterium]
MPNYDYRCPQCGKFTVYQGIKEKALETCPSCGSPVYRLIGRNVGIVYKCSGFYCTDTRPPSPPDEAKKPETGDAAVSKAVNE